MRFLHPTLSLLAVVAFSLPALYAADAPTKTNEVAAHNQTIPHDGSAKYYKNGYISSCTLARDVTITGNTLPAGSKVLFKEDGRLFRCVLSRDATFSGVAIPAKSTVFFNARGRMGSCWFSVDTLIQGHLCRANDDGFGNCFYLNGKLCAAWLVNDEVVDGIPCTSSANFFKMPIKAQRAGTGRMLYLYPNGKLMQGMLSKDFTIGGHAYKKGDIVRFDEEGNHLPGAAPVPPPPRW